MSENGASVGDALRLLDTLRPEEVKSFLETLIEEDQAILAKFLRRFGSADLAGLKADLLYELRQAEQEHSYYGDGFVDWRNASSFAYRIRQCVDNHVSVLVDRGDYESALTMGFEVYLFLTQVDVDDSDGFTEDMVTALDDVWDDIFDAAEEREDDGLFRLLFDKLNEYLFDETIQERAYSPSMGHDIYNCQCEHIEDYIVDRFCIVSAYAPLVQEMADHKLELAREEVKARKAANERMGYDASYGVGHHMRNVARWILVRLKCMRAMGVPYEEQLAFAQDCLTLQSVCLYLLDEREEAGDYAEALRLIQIPLDDAKRNDRPAPSWALVEAIGLYEHEGDATMVRSLLEELVVNGAKQADATEWFRKLKEMCPEDEWLGLRETIFTRVDNNQARWRYLAEEGLFDRLMDEAEAKGVSALRDFEPDLAARYPERVLALHEKDLMGKDGNDPRVGSTRNSYKYFADSVRHLRSIEGGDAVADRITSKVLQMYPRRPALRDELGRA